MIYVDTSSLLKLLLAEPESQAVQDAVKDEPEVLLSPLADLEASVQLRAMWLGGELTRTQHERLRSRLMLMRNEAPFVFQPVPGSVFETALRQHNGSERIHCRAFDRLHLAAMEELGITRLMTNDSTQAAAAKVLGYEVNFPR